MVVKERKALEKKKSLYSAIFFTCRKIYNTLMSQVVAGKKFGGLNEVESVRFDLRKSEISELERMGLVPMVNEYSKVMAFSAKTLFNGDNLGLQTYSVVRVFDYITKVLIDFLNRRAFEIGLLARKQIYVVRL